MTSEAKADHWFTETFTVWGELFDPATPQPGYEAMFDEKTSIVQPKPWMTVAGNREGVDYVAHHPEDFTAEGVIAMGNIRPLIPISIEGPAHAEYRRVLDRQFSPGRMDAQEERIAEQINVLIDGVVDRGVCDFSELTREYAGRVFLGILGLPFSDIDRLVELKNGIMHPESPTGDPTEIAAIQAEAGQNIYAYFGAAVEERQREPREDMMTALMHTKIGDRTLSTEEVLDICFNLMIAGLDTVSGALACCMTYLATHADHRRQLSDDPGLIPSAVEELMRWESPVNGLFRIATRDCQVGDISIKAGDSVNAVLGSANLDPSEFPDPLTVDFTRHPNRHVAFGKGVHRCLGSHLARRVLRIAIREWHARIPDYWLQPDLHLEYALPTRTVDNLVLQWPV
jgi:cytochrome P450